MFDDLRGLVVEPANHAIERDEFGVDAILAMLQLLHDRLRSRLHGGDEAHVRLVDDASDTGLDLFLAALRFGGELGEADVECPVDLGLERRDGRL